MNWSWPGLLLIGPAAKLPRASIFPTTRRWLIDDARDNGICLNDNFLRTIGIEALRRVLRAIVWNKQTPNAYIQSMVCYCFLHQYIMHRLTTYTELHCSVFVIIYVWRRSLLDDESRNRSTLIMTQNEWTVWLTCFVFETTRIFSLIITSVRLKESCKTKPCSALFLVCSTRSFIW